MKKRTVCFGWTKTFQRRVAHAGSLTKIAASLDSRAALIEADPKRRKLTDPKPIRDNAQSLYTQARLQVAAVKLRHIARVKQLRGAA